MAVEPRKTFLLRMDPALWTELESWAQEELRSVNGQIEFVLRLAVAKRKNLPAASTSGESQASRGSEAKP